MLNRRPSRETPFPGRISFLVSFVFLFAPGQSLLKNSFKCIKQVSRLLIQFGKWQTLQSQKIRICLYRYSGWVYVFMKVLRLAARHWPCPSDEAWPERGSRTAAICTDGRRLWCFRWGCYSSACPVASNSLKPGTRQGHGQLIRWQTVLLMHVSKEAENL